MEIIHIVLGKANPERMNGVNKVVYQLATKQAEDGKKVSVWGITKVPDHNYGERNFETHLFKAQKNPFRIDPELKKSLLAKKGKAVFHLHGGWIPTFSTISRILANGKIPFVFTPHGAYNTIAMKRSRSLKKVYFALFEKPLLKRVHKVHCIGESEVSGLNRIFPTDKTFLLPYGFESGTTSIPAENKQRENFIIGFVGRLDIYTKGLDLLLDVFDRFNERIPDSKLWIVGDSDQRAEFEKLIEEKDLQQHVVLWGSKFGKDKEELMQAMDVFAHPSRNEGLPASVLEAAAMGIPCVVTEATNVAAYVTRYNCGKAVANEDTRMLLNVLLELHRDHQNQSLHAIGENGRRMVQDAFNWRTIISQFDQLYQVA